MFRSIAPPAALNQAAYNKSCNARSQGLRCSKVRQASIQPRRRPVAIGMESQALTFRTSLTNICEIYAGYPQHTDQFTISAAVYRYFEPLMPPGAGRWGTLSSRQSRRQGLHPNMTGSLWPPITMRSQPCADDLRDSRRMAWEILRRRSDYHRQECERKLLQANPPVQLIRASAPPSRWGLMFR